MSCKISIHQFCLLRDLEVPMNYTSSLMTLVKNNNNNTTTTTNNNNNNNNVWCIQVTATTHSTVPIRHSMRANLTGRP